MKYQIILHAVLRIRLCAHTTLRTLRSCGSIPLIMICVYQLVIIRLTVRLLCRMPVESGVICNFSVESLSCRYTSNYALKRPRTDTRGLMFPSQISHFCIKY